jgi:hypothetical protein
MVGHHNLQHISDNFETVKLQELDNTWYKKITKTSFIVTETVTDKLDAGVREMEKQIEKQN